MAFEVELVLWFEREPDLEELEAEAVTLQGGCVVVDSTVEEV